jgi:hypothetical protein
MPTPRATDRTIYRLKVTLQDTQPPIWRRVEVPATMTLAGLHDVIQAVMGWEDGHLHQFETGEDVYGDRSILDDPDVRSERTARLGQVAPAPGARLRYLYDFGDSWDHVVLVEAVLPAEPGVRYPRCTAGRRAGPPEDCGGVWGYESLLEILADPEHPDHADMKEWAGGDIDPEAFDLATINARLTGGQRG